MAPSLTAAIDEALAGLKRKAQFRALPGPPPRGRTFASNDYLGLAHHPAVIEAAATALTHNGTSASASRLLDGDRTLHHNLETKLARLVQQPHALLFPTGYQANLGTLTSLGRLQNTHIFSDALNHASIVDGCRLAKCPTTIYPHLDIPALDALISQTPCATPIIITESVFSMDGDIAPLAALDKVAKSHNAFLIVDEAHAIGVLGPKGAGACAAAGVTPDATIGTLGKALGAGGGFLAAAESTIAYMVNTARPFIYTTGLPPATAAAAAQALSLATGTFGDTARAQLRATGQSLAQYLDNLPTPPGQGTNRTPHIQPIHIGENDTAVTSAREIAKAGIRLPAIRPPTVPPGTARLRVTLTAQHTHQDIDALIAALDRTLTPQP